MQRYQLPIQRGEGGDGVPQALMLFICKIPAFGGVVVGKLRRGFIGQVLIPAAVVDPEVPAHPEEPILKRGDLIRQAQICLYKSLCNEIFRQRTALTKAQAVQQRGGIISLIELLQNLVFRIASPLSL